MSSKLSVKLRYFPTARQWDAIKDLNEAQRLTGDYEGAWLISDTVRYLISLPYVANDYPTRVKRLPLKTVNVSKSFQKSLPPIQPEESGCAYVSRLLTSGLIQEGYLKADEEVVRVRSPRKCEVQELVSA